VLFSCQTFVLLKLICLLPRNYDLHVGIVLESGSVASLLGNPESKSKLHSSMKPNECKHDFIYTDPKLHDLSQSPLEIFSN